MRRSSDGFEKMLYGCSGVVFALFIIGSIFCASPVVGTILLIVIGVSWVIGSISESKRKKQYEQEERLRAEEFNKKEAAITDFVRAKPYELLTKDDFRYLLRDLPDSETEKLCLDILKSGNRYAIGPLIDASERIIKRLSPFEVINECDTIIKLVPNSRSFYYKAMALKQLRKYDEALVAMETAIKIDQTEYSPELRFLGYNLKIAEKELAQIKALARRMHIEKDGDFNLVKTGTEYEKFICGILRRQGCSCKRVGQSGDYGADILVNLGRGTLVIQCKFYSSPVGYDAVQQVYTAKSIYNGTWCCVVSNATFTRQAIEGGRKLGVKLLSHVDIAEYLKSLKERC